MSTISTQPQVNGPATKPARVTPIQWVAFAVIILVSSSLLFIAAGTINWPAAWIYTGISLFVALGGRALAAMRSPDLLAERARSIDMADAKSWDRKLVPFIGILGPIVINVVAGLDHRFGWTADMGIVALGIGITLLAGGYLFATWALVENKFFSGVVRIQTDRGHCVIDSGPYRAVRHPGYAGSLIGYYALSLVLSSLWVLIPVVLFTVVLVIRTALEDKTLQNELPGYADYATRTRFRLLPGIW
jgi:protein-S-isoprenylcysteine O-methyltransferase Ste14